MLKGTLQPMLPEEAGHVEVHMASHRFCLRLCFLGLVTLSLCSIVFIMTRGKDCNFFLNFCSDNSRSFALGIGGSPKHWWVIRALHRNEVMAY